MGKKSKKGKPWGTTKHAGKGQGASGKPSTRSRSADDYASVASGDVVSVESAPNGTTNDTTPFKTSLPGMTVDISPEKRALEQEIQEEAEEAQLAAKRK